MRRRGIVDLRSVKVGNHVRKAFASKGDDVTLSRWVKTGHADRPLKPARPRQVPLPGFANASIEAGRSLFYRKGVKPADELANVLVSGHSNVKIGRDVRKGALRGYWIYTLSLEERATCPRSCHHWLSCYGNNMPFASRVDHRDAAALERAIERDVKRLLAVRGRAGILVRLHALGDFYDVAYVYFWRQLLAMYPRLAVYGYTANLPTSADARERGIAQAVDRINCAFPTRSFIRFSNGGQAENCTLPIRHVDEAVNAIVCPEQTGKTAACATCGLCWGTRRNIAFLEH
jgi:hypothetical protein